MTYPHLSRINYLRRLLGMKPLAGWRQGYEAINTYRIQLEREVGCPAALGLDL